MAAEVSNLEVLERYAALGPDFLTWLAVRSLRGDLPAPESEPGMEVQLLGPITLAASHGEATKVTLAGDEAASAPEVQSALRQGKRLLRAKVQFDIVDMQYVFTLDAETFDLRSVKLPVPKVPDLDEYLRMRIQALQHLDRVVRELFEVFLPVRLEPAAWKAEVTSWNEA